LVPGGVEEKERGYKGEEIGRRTGLETKGKGVSFYDVVKKPFGGFKGNEGGYHCHGV